MLKNVYDGIVYHKAGQEVDVTNDVAKWYFDKGFAVEFKIDEPTIEIKEEKAQIETKEEKKVYKLKTKSENQDATDSDN